MSKNNYIAAIDLGTDKCTTLIASVGEDNQLRVVGVSAVPTKGMRRSMIVDLEQVVATLTQSVDAAERMAGFDIDSCYVSVSGSHIQSLNSKGVVAVANPDQEVISADVDRVIEAAKAVSLPSDRQVIHIIPRYFKVDSQEGIRDPVGMTGVRLESEAHIITGLTTSLKNLEKCINDIGLKVNAFVFSGLASSEVVLSDTEKELGVALIDLGAGSTNFCVFVEGAMEYSGSIPIGARHITQDIALGCRISMDSAEKIKLYLSEGNEVIDVKPQPGESKEDLAKRRKKVDILDLEKLGVADSDEKFSKKTLVHGIMEPRIIEIMKMISDKLDKKELLGQIPAGLVFTGGGAETVALIEVAKKVFRLPARIGEPEQMQGLVSDIQRPAFSTSIGLLEYGKQQGQVASSGSNFNLDFLSKLKLQSIGSNLTKLFKKLLP